VVLTAFHTETVFVQGIFDIFQAVFIAHKKLQEYVKNQSKACPVQLQGLHVKPCQSA
jgi:hypothetical protein